MNIYKWEIELEYLDFHELTNHVILLNKIHPSNEYNINMIILNSFHFRDVINYFII